jgi:hypothetical protein
MDEENGLTRNEFVVVLQGYDKKRAMGKAEEIRNRFWTG